MTDKELEQIYNEAYKAVYWTALGLLGNEADAEDIVQDTFVTLIESYDSIKDKSKVTAWLKKTAANKCLDRIKLAKTDNMDEEFFDSVEAVPEDFLPDSIIESEDARRIVMDIINNKLSDDIRRTLILFYFDDMSTKEIAEVLGIPQGTVSWRLNFAKKTIKKEVEKYEKDNKTKLFGMALPFLSKLFMKEAEQVPFKSMPAKLVSLSASTQASHAGVTTKAALSAAKRGTGIMINKVLIGGIAAVAAVGVTLGIIISVAGKNADTEQKPAEESVTTIISSTREVTEETIHTTTQETTESTQIGFIDDCTYLLTGMTDDEVLDEVTMLLNMKPDNGMTTSDYSKTFKYDPQQTQACSMIFYSRTSSFHRDAIMSVNVKGVKEDMDWKVWYDDNPRTSVKFVITDEDRAIRLFSILQERLKRDWDEYYDRYEFVEYKDGSQVLNAEKDAPEKTLRYTPLALSVYENKDDGSKSYMITIERPSMDVELGGK